MAKHVSNLKIYIKIDNPLEVFKQSSRVQYIYGEVLMFFAGCLFQESSYTRCYSAICICKRG